MKFANLHMLLWIWIVPVLFLLVLRGHLKRKRILEGFAKPRAIGAIAWESSSVRRWIKASLILTSLLMSILALSGPQYGYKWREVERRGVDLIIALDCSRSMLATDVQPSRLERAKREISDLLKMLTGDRIGLAAFAGVSFLQCPLTLDYNAFYLFLESLTPDFLPVGGTDLDAAIRTALKGFDQKANTDKAIILITDGESTGGNPTAAAEEAANSDVKIFCIGVGQEEGVPVVEKDGALKKDAGGNIVLTKLDEATLKKIALITGGAYVRSVAGDMDLDTIYFGEIRGKMEQSALASGREQIWENRFQWFLSLAVAALLAEILIPAARRFPIMVLCVISLFLSVPAFSWAVDASDSMRKGREAYEREKYPDALKHFIDAQLAKPDDPIAYYNVGNAYYKNGDYETARLQYEKVLETDDKELKQKALYNIGNAYFRQNKIKAAIESYEKALELNPEDKETAQNLNFAKKALEQQQQQTSQDRPSEDQQDQEKEGQENEKPSDSGQTEENGGQREPRKSDSGKQETKSGQEDQSESGQGPEPQRSLEQNGSDAQENSPSEGEEKMGSDESAAGDLPEDQVDSEQVRRVLNRLQDRPGGAMIPSYGKQKVEKDW